MELLKVTHVESVLECPSSWPLQSTSSLEPQQRPGTLHLTPHHLVFNYSSKIQNDQDKQKDLWLPIPLILSLTLHPPSSAALTPLVARTRDFRVHTLLFRDHTKAQQVYDSVKALVNSATLQSLHAFAQPPAEPYGPGEGWHVYDHKKELERMGALGERSQAWRTTDVNAAYEFCDTYPAALTIPTKISDPTLKYGKSYRSKFRIPALVYLHWANLGSITRSSQPMVGLKNARSIQDEKLIEAIFHSHAQHSSPSVFGAKASNLIIDARPTTNAVANSVKGAGTENMEHYKDCRKAYLGIDNIHVMRDSLRALMEALVVSENAPLDKVALKRSGWLKHLSAILEGAVLIAKNVHIANSHVLVHCSDGWDRTAQLSALAQLCLDPYYRTLRGFAVLVEKDWLSFGHKFGHRSGHLVPDRTSFAALPGEGVSAQAAFLATMQRGLAFSSAAFKETSPVFHQFLDCVYQILRQFPARFEFNQDFLQDLYRQMFSCEWGTFLFNSEHDRAAAKASTATRSVWERYLTTDGIKSQWLNPAYKPELDNPDSRAPQADQGVVLPNPKDVSYWFELFGRDDEDMNSEEPEHIEDPASPSDPPVVAIVDANGAPAPPVAAAPNQPDGLVENINNVSLSAPRKSAVAQPRSASPAPGSAPTSPPPRSSASPSSSTYNAYGGGNAYSSSSSESSSAPAWASAAQPALSNAVASMWKFGGSSWKSLQKGYQDAVKDFQNVNSDETAPSTSTSQASPVKDGRTRPAPSTLGSQFDPWRAQSTLAPTSDSSLPRVKEDRKASLTDASSGGRHPPRLPTQMNPWDGPASGPEPSANSSANGSTGDPLGVGL